MEWQAVQQRRNRRRRVLVTGASGFIGRQTLAPLAHRGFEVHALTRSPLREASTPSFGHETRSSASPTERTEGPQPGRKESRGAPAKSPVGGPAEWTWHVGNLLDPDGARECLEKVRPTDLLHLAWNVEHGAFWTAENNLDWVTASLRLLQQFREVGGERVVTAGSCAEYDWSFSRLSENDTPRRPATLYGAAKNALYELQTAYAREHGLSTAWGRVFFVYGPHEDPRRLVSSVVLQLLQGGEAETSEGLQERDFLHVADLAEAFAALLDSAVEGPINLASGTVHSIRSVVETLGDLTARPELLRVGARPNPQDEPRTLAADVGRLTDEVGWTPGRDLEAGLRDTVDWWRRRLSGPGQGT